MRDSSCCRRPNRKQGAQVLVVVSKPIMPGRERPEVLHWLARCPSGGFPPPSVSPLKPVPARGDSRSTFPTKPIPPNHPSRNAPASGRFTVQKHTFQNTHKHLNTLCFNTFSKMAVLPGLLVYGVICRHICRMLGIGYGKWRSPWLGQRKAAA